MHPTAKPKNLIKLKRLEDEHRRLSEAVRMLCDAASVQYDAGIPLYMNIEGKLVPRVRFLAEQAKVGASKV